MRDLIAPTPNLNGNSKDDLIKKLRVIRRGIQQLDKDIRDGSDLWHGRNFQTQSNGDVVQRIAMDGWHQRIALLQTWHMDMERLMVEIDRA